MPRDTLDALLRALDDPSGGGALWDLHAPDALLLVGGGLARRADLPREAYAAAFEADGALYPRVRPGKPRGPALSAVRELRADDAGGGRTIAWFEATEAATGTPVAVALGLAPAGLVWSTLVPAARDWGWATGEAQALADYPYGRGLYPRGWLDVAWQRHFGHAKPAILTLPEAAFTCQGSGDCCKVDWAIEVDAGFQAVLDRVDWGPARPDLAGVQLPVTAEGTLAVKPMDGPCKFLDPDGRCAVHRTLGRPLFPTCALFPFAFAQTPDGLAFSTSALCGAARAGLGPSLAERHGELLDRVAIAASPPLRTPVYRVARGEAVPWPAFRAAEAALLDALAGEGAMAARLWAGTIALGGAPGGAPLPPVAADRGAIAAFLAPWLAHLDLAGSPSLERDAPLPEAALLGRVLRNLHWSKVLSFHFDLATSHAVGVAMWLLVRHVHAAHGRVPAGVWAELGKMFMHGAGMRPYLGDDEAARARRAMLGDPAFAGWLLTY